MMLFKLRSVRWLKARLQHTFTWREMLDVARISAQDVNR